MLRVHVNNVHPLQDNMEMEKNAKMINAIALRYYYLMEHVRIVLLIQEYRVMD